MKLTHKHLQIIKEAIVKLECSSCELIMECQGNQNKYCKEISEWLRKQEEEENN